MRRKGEQMNAERTFYIDNENGDDTRTGLSPEAAWKTLERANRQEFQPGDALRLKRGGSWHGMLCPKGSGSRECPITVDAYGEAEGTDKVAAPVIHGDGAYAAVYLEGVSFWQVRNIGVTNRAEERGVRQGICICGKPEGITQGIVIENCEIFDVQGENRRNRNVYESMYWNSGIYVTMPGRSSRKNHLHDIIISGNYVHDVLTSGIRVNQQEDFINDIHHTHVVVRRNRIERTGSDGIIVANCISPLIDSNVCRDAGALGSLERTRLIAGIWVCAVSNALIQRNEVSGTHLFMDDGTAFDTDWGTEGTTVFQYNYTHDNAGGFWLDCSGLNYNEKYEKTILRYNISLRDGWGIAVGDQGLPVEFYGNIFAFDKTAALCVGKGGRSFHFRDNLFLFREELSDHWGEAEMSGNQYAAQVCMRDMQGTLGDGLDAAEMLREVHNGREWLEEKWGALSRFSGKA